MLNNRVAPEQDPTFATDIDDQSLFRIKKILVMNNLSNHVQLIGHLGKDVETFTTNNGNMVARATIATNHVYTNKLGEKVQETDWHQLVAWGKTAELMKNHASKGTQLCVVGRLVNRSFEGKDGNKKYVTEVIVNEFRAFKRGES